VSAQAVLLWSSHVPLFVLLLWRHGSLFVAGSTDAAVSARIAKLVAFATGYSMIRKSGNRFSEKIML
jgi:hypothetical protein